jgi:hypothetical protein
METPYLADCPVTTRGLSKDQNVWHLALQPLPVRISQVWALVKAFLSPFQQDFLSKTRIHIQLVNVNEGVTRGHVTFASLERPAA